MVRLDPRVSLVYLALQVILGHKVHQVPRDREVRQETPVALVIQAQLVHLGPRVSEGQ